MKDKVKGEKDRKPIREDFLPPFRHSIGDREINEVIDTLKSDWITTGPKTQRFEEAFKGYIGCRHALAVSSCTAGLHLSLASAGVGRGDEVITSPLTFCSTVNVIVHQNAKPVFVDIEPETFNIDPGKIEGAITDKTRAILPVHYAGHPCEMDEIIKIAREHNLIVIEDAAHATGAEYRGKRIGTLGDLTSFSFYAIKNITTAEGGMVATDNDELAEKIRILSLHGISRDAWKRYSSKGSWYYEVLDLGYKYNMTDIQASIGIHQLERIEQMQRRREEIADTYARAFRGLPEIITPTARDYVRHAWHLYPVQINPELLNISRYEFIEALRAENIGTSVHFIPVHLHPYYREQFGFRQGDFPNAEVFYENEISLPVYPRMTDRDVQDVIAAVKKVVNDNRRVA